MKRARDPDAIRDRMTGRDLTFRELADMSNCSVGTIANILDGKAVDGRLAVRVARKLRRPVDDLFVEVASSDTAQSVKERAVG